MSLEPINEPLELELIDDSTSEGSTGAAGRGERLTPERDAGRSVKEVGVGRLLKEAKLLTEGVCFEGVIKEIRIGRYGEFVPPPKDERFRDSWERRKDRVAYLIIFDTEFGTYRDVIVISAHANSRMVRLARCYDRFYIGQKVKVCIENGKPKISC